jgi:predicted Fe-Mo cluster-binding NifX family protein
MKIAVSSFGKDSKKLLDTRFGRCEYFQIYDTESGLYESFENEAKGSSQGAGVAASQWIIDRGIDVLVTGKLGPNAYELLSDSGIKLYTSESIEVEEAVQLCQEGKLEQIVSSGVGHAGLNPASGGRNRYRNS